jgi:hypothetical protein
MELPSEQLLKPRLKISAQQNVNELAVLPARCEKVVQYRRHKRMEKDQSHDKMGRAEGLGRLNRPRKKRRYPHQIVAEPKEFASILAKW